ncbi:MAG: ABC-type multidrug transport system fused ATPase/permease subunit [Arenicella sp.]|jgi:ABC-type multidrug transport system fused ATPase/permease subunit
MFAALKELYWFLTQEQRNGLLRLQFLVILMSLAEVAGVLAIGPFMALVGDIDQLNRDGLLSGLFQWSRSLGIGVESPNDFLIAIGLVALSILTLSSFISIFTLWRLSMYGAQVGADLSSRLYRYYMHQPWLFHASNNSSQLTNKIAQECQRVAGCIITPFMYINAKLVMAVLMILAIVVYNPAVAIIGVLFFAFSYFVLFTIVKERLSNYGKVQTTEQATRFKLMGEGFGGIKDTLLLYRQTNFTRRFFEAGDKFAEAKGRAEIVSQVPRYAMEFLAFGSVILLVMYLIITEKGELGVILPSLAVYALAGLKLLPAFQQIYFSTSQIRSNLSAFENLREDFKESIKSDARLPFDEPGAEKELMSFHRGISLKNIAFTYPGTNAPVLNRLSIDIPVNQTVGIVGASGSGKSTAIDILLGLIKPDSGQLLIDGEALTKQRLREWQSRLGFVAQSIFLGDASIQQNIAFALPEEEIDVSRVQKAASLAHLAELIESLPDGLNTLVGERGVQLSGGQRQRIGIARALYNNVDVLVFDEATSSLDGITEKLIMDAIHEFSGSKTIIVIAHRLTTVKQCDIIFLIDQGTVIDKGGYDELCERSPKFREMAEHA